MKKILIKYLPIVAAVLLATACSKDENNDTIGDTAQPATELPTQTNEDANDNYVAVPFSVKVDDGTSLSKIAYTEADGEKGKILSRELQPEDVGKISLRVFGNGFKTIELPLQSTNEGGTVNYYFEGQIEVESAQVQAFNNGEITLHGSFSTTPDAPITYSTTSLEHLANNCAHVYKASFASNANNVMFAEQNAYLAITHTNGENKTVRIYIAPNNTDVTLNSDGKIWLVVDGAKDIYSNELGIYEKTEEGHIYNIKRVAATGITLNLTSYEIKGVDKYIDNPITVTFTPENCSVKKVSWSSDNTNVVTVNSNGSLYSNKAGTATITATAIDGSGVTASYTVTVTEE